MKLFVQSAAAVLALFAAANAQEDPISNPRGTVANFDPANITPLLAELGVAYQVAQSNGQTVIQANADGMQFLIVPAACLGANGTGCVGAHTFAIFTGASVNMQTVNAFNQRFVFSSAGVFSDNSGVYVGRYDIADYGIARGNIISSLSNFVYIAQQFAAAVSTGAQTISQDGYADDLSAKQLNQTGLKSLGLGASAPTSHAALHRAEIEATPELVRTLMANQSTPRNKISNKRD